ncbi:hypothetical protein AN639_04845 [Candidatus Epulonipiscium fishelsonii]|uniref:Uncharacterized protein n=1 Tax=Candidatus Epulonipiscium fishelsonii TaxID=77094 RepID=A0ACC8XDB3_9FIRM|nr:hypothetical protein AN639_04845 [Epulopiscium sp. SCG-B05WGA-EpuloA1]ONI40807.1 hypothetical protein AN396_05150 [Epulopiscium sp. SCG-B11WGA-EpuloA1]
MSGKTIINEFKEKPKTAHLTIECPYETVEKFKQLGMAKNMNSAEVLAYLLQLLPNQNMKVNNINGVKIPNSNGMLQFFLNEFNIFKKKVKPSLTIKFNGTLIYSISDIRPVQKFSANKLKSDFKYIYNDEDITEYFLAIYYNIDKRKYFIYDYINVKSNENDNINLTVYRGKLAKDLNDIITKLSGYINAEESDQIEYKLAEDISNNEKMILKYLDPK